MEVYFSATAPVVPNPLQSRLFHDRLEDFIFEREVSGENRAIAVLNNIDGAIPINNGWFISFTDEQGYSHLYVAHVIEHDSDGLLKIEMFGVEFELSKFPVTESMLLAFKKDIGDFNPSTMDLPLTINDVLSFLFEGTFFHFVESSYPQFNEPLPEPFELLQGNRQMGFRKLIDQYKIEYQFLSPWLGEEYGAWADIYIYPDPVLATSGVPTLGKHHHVIFEPNPAIDGVSVKIDTSEQLTEIIPIGGGGLQLPEHTITVHPSTVGLSDHITRVIRFDEVVLHDGDEPQYAFAHLRFLARRHLEMYKSGVIDVSLDIRFEDINSFYYLNIGDRITVRVNGRQYRVRLMSKVYNPFTGEIQSLKLSNVFSLPPLDKFVRTLANLKPSDGLPRNITITTDGVIKKDSQPISGGGDGSGGDGSYLTIELRTDDLFSPPFGHVWYRTDLE